MLKPKPQNVQVFSPSRKNDGNKRRKFSSFPFSNFEKKGVFYSFLRLFHDFVGYFHDFVGHFQNSVGRKINSVGSFLKNVP